MVFDKKEWSNQQGQREIEPMQKAEDIEADVMSGIERIQLKPEGCSLVSSR